MLSEVDRKFSGIEYLRPYAAATMLDPRYKKYVFENPKAVASIVRFLSTLLIILLMLQYSFSNRPHPLVTINSLLPQVAKFLKR